MMITQKDDQELVTGEKLFQLGNVGPCELVNGRIVPTLPAGYVHALLEARFADFLLRYAAESRRWQVLVGGAGIYIRRNPDTVRAADIALISGERAARRTSDAYLDVAPELVVEIISPDDLWSDVITKLGDYFAVGVFVVWMLEPRLRTLFAHRSVTDVRQFKEGDVLADELLPGFSLALAELFRD